MRVAAALASVIALMLCSCRCAAADQPRFEVVPATATARGSGESRLVAAMPSRLCKVVLTALIVQNALGQVTSSNSKGQTQGMPLTAGRSQSLERDAQKESFISRVLGTDCYTDALRAIRTECRNLGAISAVCCTDPSV